MPRYRCACRNLVRGIHENSRVLFSPERLGVSYYIGNEIDVGVEILPMKTMQQQMSSGVSYFEGELYNVIRQGRNVPAVPLVLIGIEG